MVITTPVIFDQTFDATTAATLVLSPSGRNITHAFIGLTYLDGGGSVVTPSAGTVTITVKTTVNPEVDEAITGGTAVDVTAALNSFSFAANAESVTVTPTGVTGATDVRIRITTNGS